MADTDNLDKLINEYSASLLKTYEKRNTNLKEDIPAISAVGLVEDMPTEPISENEDSILPEGEESVLPESEETPDPLTDTATFFATVRTGGGAFPVPEAKIIVRKDNTIMSFLITDENGDTSKVTLPAYPREDSLSSETVKTVDYLADVYRTGFQEKRNLPVTAVGGAEIVLNVELTPSEERME